MLLNHHSAPRQLMGKWKQGAEQKQAGWGFWSGSWSAWKPPSSAAASSTIPAYDAQKPKFEAQSQPSLQLESLQDSEAGLVQGLQKAVNSARKAEGRVKRIHAERAERQQQWAAWEQELRRTSAKERARYAAALARLDGELKDAMKQQAEARLVLRQAASGEIHQEPAEPQDMATEEFDALMSGVPDLGCRNVSGCGAEASLAGDLHPEQRCSFLLYDGQAYLDDSSEAYDYDSYDAQSYCTAGQAELGKREPSWCATECLSLLLWAISRSDAKRASLMAELSSKT